jgi:hypothetical protein
VSRVGFGALLAALAAATVVTAAAPAATGAPRFLQFYSVTTAEQFLNHADDRARGYGDNPFGNFKAPTATTKERSGGPFPGDQALFSFKLYKTQKKANASGLAVFTCFYNFKRHGYCDAIYDLKGGSILCSGGLDFSAKDFALVVTGGTGVYRGAVGTCESTTVGYAQTRLTFKLSL